MPAKRDGTARPRREAGGKPGKPTSSARGFGSETRSGPRPGPKARKRPIAPAKTGSAEPRQARARAPAASEGGEGERIQKYLATAGVASRRAIEALIAEGRITVNGEVATPGQKVGAKDRIAIDGKPQRISVQQDPTRVLLYKKRVGEVVTRDDPEGRRTVFRKLPELAASRWIAVGRLDINTSGLLLLTNDGELARRLMHPSYEVQRTYAVRVLGTIDAELIQRLRRGVELDDGPARFETIVAVDSQEDDEAEGAPSAANHWFHVTLRQGRNRLVRRLMESQDLQVSRLIRIGYGPVKLGGGIRSGSYRELDRDELRELLKAVDMGKGPGSDRSNGQRSGASARRGRS